MNQIFAWLVFIGMLVGVFTALNDPLEAESAAPVKVGEVTGAIDNGTTVTISLLGGWDGIANDESIMTTKTIVLVSTASPPTEIKATPPKKRWKHISDKGKKISDAIIKMPEIAVDILLGLIGPMALWLGVMKIAEEAGLVRMLALALQPILRPLFPRIPKGHPALGAIILNVAANMLGTGNAATPLGLKAMNELQKLNKEKDVATDAMIMFLAINTSSVTLIPFTTAAYRASNDSSNVFAFLVPTILATICSTVVAVTAVTIFKRFSKPPDDYFDEFSAAGEAGVSLDDVYKETLGDSEEKEDER